MAAVFILDPRFDEWHSPLSASLQRCHILLADVRVISGPVIRYPHRLPHKQPHGFGVVSLIQGEAVVDAGRQGDQVSFSHGDPDPPILLVPDVEVGLAVQDVADLIIQVQVLLEEPLQLFLIVRKCVLVNGDYVHIGIALVFTDLLQLWVCFVDISIQLPVKHPELP